MPASVSEDQGLSRFILVRVLLVALPETTPVSEAAHLQEDLRRANIEPWAWLINMSLIATGSTDPLLRERMRAEGIDGTVYTHPIGDHGHGAGPPIGMTDYQEGVPLRGDYVFRPDTWHSIELNVMHKVPEWNGQPVRMALEEDAALDADGTRRWVLARQERFHLVR